MYQILFIVVISALFLFYSYFLDKKGFELESQFRLAAWFGFIVFGLVLAGRMI